MYDSNQFGWQPTAALKESLYNADQNEDAIAPHPGHLFKLLSTTDFMLLDGEHFLLLG
jgi:hypothetical protein